MSSKPKVSGVAEVACTSHADDGGGRCCHIPVRPVAAIAVMAMVEVVGAAERVGIGS